MELVGNKDGMQRNVDTLKSTVQLTELIIKGKDMELLLLQKEIQEKLQVFSKTSVASELPKTASKVIHFVPGMLDMGYIHDADRPLLSQTRHRFSNQSDELFDPSDCFDTIETQTDSTLVRSVESSTNTQMLVRCDGATQTENEARVNGHRNSADYQTITGYNSDDEQDREPSSARRRRRRREREKAVEAETFNETHSKRAQRHQNSYDID